MEDILNNGYIHSSLHTYHRVQMIKSEHARHLQQTTTHLQYGWQFKIAFFSYWQMILPNGRASITNSFHNLLVTTEDYEIVRTEILDLIFFTSKFDCRTDAMY